MDGKPILRIGDIVRLQDRGELLFQVVGVNAKSRSIDVKRPPNGGLILKDVPWERVVRQSKRQFGL